MSKSIARSPTRREEPASGVDADLVEQVVEGDESPARFDIDISTPSRTNRTHE